MLLVNYAHINMNRDTVYIKIKPAHGTGRRYMYTNSSFFTHWFLGVYVSSWGDLGFHCHAKCGVLSLIGQHTLPMVCLVV